MTDPLHVISSEHDSIAAVLHGLRHLARELVKPGVRPQTAVLHAMIYYIDAYPERLHHPKEDDWLFARLVLRAPEAATLVDELKQEHVEGAGKIRELEAALKRYEGSAPAGAEEFAAVVERYVDFHWKHMRREEQEVLPLARRVLTAEDLAEIGRAFAGHGDPIADLRERDLEALFQRIVGLAPAPIGLGQPWKQPDAKA